MIGPNAKGLSNDTVATLTPFVLGQDLLALGQPPWAQWAAQSLLTYEEDRMYYWNQSLPHGFFSRSPLGQVNGSLSTELPATPCMVAASCTVHASHCRNFETSTSKISRAKCLSISQSCTIERRPDAIDYWRH